MTPREGSTRLEQAWEWWTNARLLRWSVAALIVLGGLAFSVFGESVCRDQLAAVGNTAVVKTCGPVEFSDLPVVAGILLLFIVIAPDLSEVSIGILSLKQRVQEAKQEQDKIRDEFEDLKQTIAVSLSAIAEQSTSVTTAVQAPDLAATVTAISRLVSSDPVLQGAQESAGEVPRDYSQTLGE